MTIDFTVPEEKARHDRIVALVEQMLRLHQEPPEPLPPEENENRFGRSPQPTPRSIPSSQTSTA